MIIAANKEMFTITNNSFPPTNKLLIKKPIDNLVFYFSNTTFKIKNSPSANRAEGEFFRIGKGIISRFVSKGTTSASRLDRTASKQQDTAGNDPLKASIW